MKNLQFPTIEMQVYHEHFILYWAYVDSSLKKVVEKTFENMKEVENYGNTKSSKR